MITGRFYSIHTHPTCWDVKEAYAQTMGMELRFSTNVLVCASLFVRVHSVTASWSHDSDTM